MDDPITIIANAITLGVAAGIKLTAEQAIKNVIEICTPAKKLVFI
jgi:hypothetical protein